MSQHYTIALLGSEGVGKTDLTLRFTENRYEEVYDPTIEDLHKKSFQVDGVAVRLDILDTAGQVEFQHYLQEYLETREAFILVFDVTSMKSFEVVSKLALSIFSEKGEDVPILYVGNKVDLEGDRQIHNFAPQQLQTHFKYTGYIETSAKMNTNVEQAFSQLVRLIWKRNTDKRKGIGFSEVIFEPVMTEPNEGKSKRSTPRKKKCPCVILCSRIVAANH